MFCVFTKKISMENRSEYQWEKRQCSQIEYPTFFFFSQLIEKYFLVFTKHIAVSASSFFFHRRIPFFQKIHLKTQSTIYSGIFIHFTISLTLPDGNGFQFIFRVWIFYGRTQSDWKYIATVLHKKHMKICNLNWPFANEINQWTEQTHTLFSHNKKFANIKWTDHTTTWESF